MTILSLTALNATHISSAHQLVVSPLTSILVTVMLFVTAFLVILNAIFVWAFRKRRPIMVLSFLASSLIELVVFILVLLLRLSILTHVPFTLPPGLPINQAEIGTTLALAIGLFPAAYWQGTSLSQLRQRMADDAKVIKNREGGVRIRNNTPGEWLN